MLASSRPQTIVWTSRISEAEKFYSGVLGLPLKGKSHGALVYDVGGSDLRVSAIFCQSFSMRAPHRRPTAERRRRARILMPFVSA
jgi:hypothetical protein